MNWTELEISSYQDHVIKHVLGATVLGWAVIEDAMHVLLDVGLLWTIYVNAEMSLMAQAVAIEDLASEQVTRSDIAQLSDDAERLISDGREVTELNRFIAAPVECTITSVDVFESDSRRRILVVGESGDLEIETSLERSEFTIDAKPH
jgi:hypothetical protein